MNTETFEHIVCQSGAGRPASIRFFGRITEESAGRFSEAFEIGRASCRERVCLYV